MQHIKVTFKITNEAESDVLVAMLSEAGYDGFEEQEHELLAYVEELKFNEDDLKLIASSANANYSIEIVPAQNWNALWESNFEPVIVKDFCTIRAHFHEINTNTPYTITITPKMSFGTGHHATTQQVMMLMKEVSFARRTVLDFGTGTGVLAILAELLGAKKILAIDNDEWSVENAKENIERNNSKNVDVRQGSLEDFPFVKNDIILANINRNILLQHMEELYNRLDDDGLIIMSGLLAEDKEIMLQAAINEGFHLQKATEQQNWIALLFAKK